jgi:UDP-N-acetylmuramate dehydrogenase
MNVYDELKKKLGKNRVKANYDLSNLQTMRVKTCAQMFFVAHSREDLIAAKKASLALNVPMIVLGGGSNMVFSKKVFPGLVVANRYIDREVLETDTDFVKLKVSSGYPTAKLVNETIEEGFAGLELFMGLPGTVGGAVVMNSKWSRPPVFFGDSLIAAEIIDDKGNLVKVDREYFGFSYGASRLQDEGSILLEAVFKLKKSASAALKKTAGDALAYRKESQPYGVNSSGCFFRNISVDDQKKLGLPTASAGYLIDKAGLKTIAVGDFCVSDKHANFIINAGRGKPEDLAKLVKIIKEKIKKKYGVDLIEEVIIA